MGQALYRKHRPKKLSEVIGQEHVTKTLEQALKTGRISHAYLLTGPRGTGKTSIARILAHEINKLPYDDDSAHLDIIEIDAASNRRIDEIRELRDKVYVAPTSLTYKVYIIDEVHMLTKEAFNALLKTLEEPPAHVVFILATTDAHKVPETIISRTQRFSLKPIERSQVMQHLKTLAEEENITVDDAALELLAEHGEGSFRDSIGLLDQASSHADKLGVEEVQALLGLPPASGLQTLRDNLIAGDIAQLITTLNSLYEQGYQAAAIAKQLGKQLRHELINNPEPQINPKLLLKLLDVPQSHDPERYLEIILLETTLPMPQAVIPTPRSESRTGSTEGSRTPRQAVTRSLDVARDDTSRGEPAVTIEAPQVTEQPMEAAVVELVTKETERTKKPKPKTAATGVLDEASWSQVLGALKGNHNTLYGIVRMAQPQFNQPDELVLAFAFPFHQKRLNEARNRQLLSNVIEEITGQTITITCITDKAARPAKPGIVADQAPDPAADPTLSTISNIFGGAELLE